MNIEMTRRRAAWLLLTVYVMMMAVLSLHVHPLEMYEDSQCYQCANHLPHSGHLSATQAAMHDCVLCQLHSVTYVLAAAVTLAVLLPATAVPFMFYRQRVAVGERNSRCSRAPPYCV